MRRRYERLPVEERKKEIMEAATRLFIENGFEGTTMESVVKNVSLSKGGVYRIYPSTTEILKDIISEGLIKRNQYYENHMLNEIAEGREITVPYMVKLIGNSLRIDPEVSAVYVEFLLAKRRSPQLEELYRELYEASVKSTTEIIDKFCPGALLKINQESRQKLTEFFNAAVIGIHVLNISRDDDESRLKICEKIAELILDADIK